MHPKTPQLPVASILAGRIDSYQTTDMDHIETITISYLPEADVILQCKLDSINYFRKLRNHRQNSYTKEVLCDTNAQEKELPSKQLQI